MKLTFPDITEEEYRADEAIANSDFKHATSPIELKDYKAGKLEKKETAYFSFGTHFEDYLVMSTNEFNTKYCVVEELPKSPSGFNQITFVEQVAALMDISLDTPTNEELTAIYNNIYKTKDDKKGSKSKKLYDEYKDYISFERDSREKLTTEYVEQLEYRKKAVLKLPLWNELMSKEVYYQPTMGIEPRIKTNGVFIKGKPDWIIVDNENKVIYILDLKTTGKPIGDFEYSFRKFKYDRQLAFYKKLLQHHISLEGFEVYEKYADYSIKAMILAVESGYPGYAKFIPIPTRVMKHGNELFAKDLERVKQYLTSNRLEHEHDGQLVFNWNAYEPKE